MHPVATNLHCREGWKVLWQLRPLAPCRNAVLDRIPQHPRVVLARATDLGNPRQQWSDGSAFVIRAVACGTDRPSVKLATGGSGQPVILAVFATPDESQAIEIA